LRRCEGEEVTRVVKAEVSIVPERGFFVAVFACEVEVGKEEAFLAMVRWIALSSTGVAMVPLPHALEQEASAGEGLLRGARATDAPSAIPGEARRRGTELVTFVGRMAGA
jgi:hypothetical protein